MKLAQRYSLQTLRSAGRFCLLLVTGVLWASPSSAQGNATITVNDTTVVNIFIDHEATPTDSARAAIQQQFHLAAIAYYETCDCMGDDGNDITNITTGGIVLALIYIGLQLNGIKNQGKSNEPDYKYGESK